MIPELHICRKFSIQGYTKVLGIVDRNVYELYPDIVSSLVSDFILVDSGEHAKHVQHLCPLMDAMVNRGLDRSSCLVAIGGGVIGDVTGFLASIYMRGIDFIQVPTTYMSMCDHIIGKVGVNKVSKNSFGSFYSPRHVVVFEQLVEQLSTQSIHTGLVEVLKHYFVTGDQRLGNMMEDLITQPTTQQLLDAIKISHVIKSDHVARDPKDDLNIHKALSYGHTFANAFEKHIEPINHGRAVLKGMKLAGLLSSRLGILDAQNLSAHNMLCEKLARSLGCVEYSQDTIEDLLTSFRTDKISHGGQMNFVILDRIGSHRVCSVEESMIKTLLEDCTCY